MFYGHVDSSQKPPLGGRPDAKPEDHGTPNAYHCWLVLFYYVSGPAWIEIQWNNIWLRGPVTYDFTLHLRIRDHTTWLWRCVGTVFGHFLLGSHNFMVIALGSCVKWPLLDGDMEDEGSQSTMLSTFIWIKGHFAHEPRAVTMRLWEPKRRSVLKPPSQDRLLHHVGWSWTCKCSVKSYCDQVLNQMLFQWIFIHAGPHAW